jgi:hypothetical protein
MFTAAPRLQAPDRSLLIEMIALRFPPESRPD